jgi:mono/diheme cytochrome c family protein
MKRNRIGRVHGALALVLILGVGTGAYFTFRYTVVAQVQESLVNVDTTDSVEYGRTLFQTRGCSGCHSFAPVGSLGDEGPDLTGVAARHDADYIRQSIMSPNAVIAPRCPEGACQPNVMPPFGDILTSAQIEALVVYLQHES